MKSRLSKGKTCSSYVFLPAWNLNCLSSEDIILTKYSFVLLKYPTVQDVFSTAADTVFTLLFHKCANL